jgi:hypothetical protein
MVVGRVRLGLSTRQVVTAVKFKFCWPMLVYAHCGDLDRE